jgi:tetraacyldisaccharide-1-P 4'-kinase
LRSFFGNGREDDLATVDGTRRLARGVRGAGQLFCFPRGFWREYKAQRSKLQQAVVSSEEQQAALQRRLVLLDPRHVDPDLADELVRRNLDLVKPDELIVPLPPTLPAGQRATPQPDAPAS